METHHISLFPNDHFLDIGPINMAGKRVNPFTLLAPLSAITICSTTLSTDGAYCIPTQPTVRYMNTIWKQTKDS